MAQRTIKKRDGTFIEVSDEQILACPQVELGGVLWHDLTALEETDE